MVFDILTLVAIRSQRGGESMPTDESFSQVIESSSRSKESNLLAAAKIVFDPTCTIVDLDEFIGAFEILADAKADELATCRVIGQRADWIDYESCQKSIVDLADFLLRVRLFVNWDELAARINAVEEKLCLRKRTLVYSANKLKLQLKVPGARAKLREKINLSRPDLVVALGQ